MPQEPKKRHSRQRQGKRRAAIHLKLSNTIECSNCHAQILPHKACPRCGYYKGRQIIKVSKEKESKKETDESKK